MPRIVVPIASPPAPCLFNRRSSSKCQGKMTWARSLSMRLRPTWTPRAIRRVDFLQQAGRIEDHAGGHHALDLGAEDAAGDQRQFEGLAAGDDGMAGVGPALVADDDIVLLGEQIDDLALGLVAPLQSDHTRGRHRNAPRDLRKAGRKPQTLQFSQSPAGRSTYPFGYCRQYS